ncbi:hypothetical protein FKV73_02490 [Weissella paramesenteroides]|nr:hypothetical protein FKV79_04980 [Weissella paramesenteroides]KAA8438556.1 hypothetical protein FKV73_02490 [Weissella paramesenteroides]
MTKTIDEYIAHEAHKIAERRYKKGIENANHEASKEIFHTEPAAFRPYVAVSIDDTDRLIEEVAKTIEVNMKLKLVGMLVDKDDR